MKLKLQHDPASGFASFDPAYATQGILCQTFLFEERSLSSSKDGKIFFYFLYGNLTVCGVLDVPVWFKKHSMMYVET